MEADCNYNKNKYKYYFGTHIYVSVPHVVDIVMVRGGAGHRVHVFRHDGHPVYQSRPLAGLSPPGLGVPRTSSCPVLSTAFPPNQRRFLKKIQIL